MCPLVLDEPEKNSSSDTLAVQDCRLVSGRLSTVLPGRLLESIQKLIFEHCNLEERNVGGLDWPWTCRSLTSLTRLQLEVKSAIPEAFLDVTTLRELSIDYSDSEDQPQQARLAKSLINLTSLKISCRGKERLIKGRFPAVS
jgi:hypothetical protein